MSATFEEISRDSVQLPRSKRLALARFLLELDDPAEDMEASDLWHSIAEQNGKFDKRT
ncbi:hypothetical protein SH580_12345 [Coraliomargarita algicola]|uniref:Addiction module protein n=1 Tax=Coraliomargarita algicola TaxID=3092156 RepID=A0ABZ0RG84_9BACT|nr:hypothetical protein [Coraliomargarita sp. J2-16]WPJ94224.1 hypothetical protein SH580_12345 [Coraliomargarita sp. J2-16]